MTWWIRQATDNIWNYLKVGSKQVDDQYNVG